MIEFVRNKETGEVEAVKDGKITGKIVAMGDEVTEKFDNDRVAEFRKRREKKTS